MMVPKALYQGQPGVAVATIYTVPADTDSVVTEVLVCNTTANPVSFTLHKVPNGGAASAANMVICNAQIPAYTTVGFSWGLVLDTPGDTLRALATVAAALTLTISGYEEKP